MPTEIPDEKKEDIRKYRQEFYRLKEIAEIVEVSLYTAHKYGKLKEENEELKYNALSRLIEEILSRKGMNQNKIAAMIGVEKQTVSLYKRGKIFPERRILKNLFSAAGVDYKTLDEFIENQA
ncbi:hypothetical protein GF336_03225 [Candidatus Woesearchaeota archaeon]|nr:hypothetical protein [Candidatus Woesearchaeota archaeon]